MGKFNKRKNTDQILWEETYFFPENIALGKGRGQVLAAIVVTDVFSNLGQSLGLWSSEVLWW